MRKQMLALLLVTALSLTVLSPTASAQNLTSSEDNSGVSMLATNEKPMPTLSNKNINVTDTLEMTERTQWVQETTEVLEDAYQQKVINVTEDENYIIFEFEQHPVELNDQILDENEVYLFDSQIDIVKYVKPESSVSRVNVIGSKITYQWGWSDGWYNVDTLDTQTYEQAKAVGLAIIGATSKVWAPYLTAAAGLIGIYLNAKTLVKGGSYIQYYYRSKVGQVYTSDGFWYPYAYVGERRAFNRIDVAIEDSAGQWIAEIPEQTIGTPNTNPTNYDDMDSKDHYYDDAWILNTAIYRIQNNLMPYRDEFAILRG